MYQTLVIGLGNFGFALVKELVAAGSEVVVIESDQNKAQQARDLVSQVVVGDASSRELLERFSKDMNSVVVCIGEKIAHSILVTYLLKEIGVKKIIAKAASDEHGEILRKVGAHEIIYPERDMAKRLAMNLTASDVLDFVRLSDEYDIMEIVVPDKFIKKTISELHVRNKYGIEILAVRNPLEDRLTVMPTPEYEFQADDVLVILGAVESIQKFRR